MPLLRFLHPFVVEVLGFTNAIPRAQSRISRVSDNRPALLTVSDTRPALADRVLADRCYVRLHIKPNCKTTPTRRNNGNRKRNTSQGVTVAGVRTPTQKLLQLGAATFGVVTANAAANPECSELGPTSATNAARGSNWGRPTAPSAPTA
jgi:hypothetical protein